MAKVMVFPVGTGEKRYTCNGVLEINGTPARMLDSLLKSMDGDGVYSQGVWTIWAAGPADSEADVIDESWLNGGISFKRGATKNEKVNTAGGTYINPDDYWAATGFPSVSIEAYVDEDQEELTADLSLNFCTSGFQAQRMGRLAIERSRSGMVVTYPCNLKALQVKVNEVRKVSNALLGWNEKLFRVLDWQFSMMGGINLTLGEYNPAIYDIATGDMQPIPTPDPTTLPDPWTVAAPADLTVTESLYATNVASMIMVRADLEWTQPTIGVTLFEVEQNYGAGFFPVGQSPTEALTLWDVQIGPQQFRVRAVNGLGVKSEWSTLNYPVLGKQAPPPPVDLFLFSKQPGGARQFVWRLFSPPLDMAGYLIRYAKTFGATWPDMLPLHSGTLLASPYETNQLSIGDYTFGICSIDTTGNVSEPKYIEATVDDPRLLGVLQAAYPAAENWPGARTDCEIVDTFLEAIDTDTWDTIPATWEEWMPRWKMNPAATIVYEYGPVDAGLICSFTPVVVTECLGTASITVSISDDDITYSSWAAPSLVRSRYCKVRVTVTGATIPTIFGINIYLDGNPTAEDIEDLDTSTLTGAYRLGTGDIRLPIQLTYDLIKSVQIALQNVGAGWTWEIIDKDMAVGPRIKIYNASGVAADALIDATIKGIKQ